MRIIASLTTIPCRLNLIRESIQSFLDDPGFDHVLLNIPHISKKGNVYEESDIENLRKSLIYEGDRFVIHRVDRDYGPITKLVGALQWTNQPSDIIVVFDDDRKLISPVSSYFKKCIDEVDGMGVFSLGGWIRGEGWGKYQFVNSNKSTLRVDVVMGVTCIGLRRDMIDTLELLSFQADDPRFEKLDDIRISGYFASRDIPCYSMGGSPRLYLKDIDYHGTEKLSGTVNFWKENIMCMNKLSDLGIFKVYPKFSETGLSMMTFAIIVPVGLLLLILGVMNRNRFSILVGGVILIWMSFLLLRERV
jgi:hypothetical protein